MTLGDTIAHHALKVLRQTTGDQFELVNAAHRAFVATITAVAPLTVSIGADVTRAVELPLEVTVVCGVGKGDKAEWIAQKATELGAAHILFYNGQWGTSKWAPDRRGKKLARYRPSSWAPPSKATATSCRRWVFSLTLRRWRQPEQSWWRMKKVPKLVRPPGWWRHSRGGRRRNRRVRPRRRNQPAELAGLTANGFVPAGLGPRILRTETAPLYLLSAVSALSELQGVQLDE